MSAAVPAPIAAAPADWWRDAVVYQIYPRSFADASGDGVGDLPGITSRLGHLATLGVDAIWISPFYPSPQNDAGYDVSDYTDVDPLFGSLDDFDALLGAAHAAGIRVLVDLVPNHCSSEHSWFRDALASTPGSRERARFIFRPGRGTDGSEPPNNWQSVFGGGAWERVADGEWYLHLFDVTQPDFDWSNPEVAELFDDVLRFWLRRGVDGFRVDVAHGMVKAEGLPDSTFLRDPASHDADQGPMWDQDGVHAIYQRWRTVLDEFEGDRILVAEAWVSPAERMARYLRADEVHQAFNFPYLNAGWSPGRLRTVIDEALAANAAVGATTTWVLSNHDVVRPVSRLGYPAPGLRANGIGPADPQPDTAVGRSRARALALASFALPGSVYVYQGEELGLPEHGALPPDVRQDPTFWRTGGTEIGRDGCRVPLPWAADAPALGFSATGASWLPQPIDWRNLAADVQDGDPDSTLNLYRALVRLRRERGLGSHALRWNPSPPDVMDATLGDTRLVVNLGRAPVPLGDDVRVVLASEPDATSGAGLAPDRAVWLD